MRIHHLQTRFVLAGCLLVLSTMAASLWSAITFARLGAVVDRTLQESRETISLASQIENSLEREDDALLRALNDKITSASPDLEGERRRGDQFYERLLKLMTNGMPEEKQIASEMREQMDLYRSAGTKLLASAGRAGGFDLYHRDVNPLLRQAVKSCDKMREVNYREMEQWESSLATKRAGRPGLWRAFR